MFPKITSILLFLSITFVEMESVCWQKNTEREANRDVFLCRNQYFEPGKKFADPENCQCYYHCSYKQQPCYYCCPDGQAFYPTLGCITAKASKCVNKSPEFTCLSNGKYPHKHCRKYWDCSNGKPVEESCLTEQHWNDWEKRCQDDKETHENPTNCNHD